jgi:hypothetical protein
VSPRWTADRRWLSPTAPDLPVLVQYSEAVLKQKRHERFVRYDQDPLADKCFGCDRHVRLAHPYSSSFWTALSDAWFKRSNFSVV